MDPHISSSGIRAELTVDVPGMHGLSLSAVVVRGEAAIPGSHLVAAFRSRLEEPLGLLARLTGARGTLGRTLV